MAVAALVVGIISLVTFWLCGLGALLGLVAAILGAIGLSKAKELPGQTGRGQAIAGIVTGVIGIVLAVGAIVAFSIMGTTAVDNLEDFERRIDTDPADGTCNMDRWVEDPDC